MKNYEKNEPNLCFKQAKKEYKEIILSWFKEEHVKEFYYGKGLQNTLHNLELYCQEINDNGRYKFDHWIAFYNSVPFGFLMTSPITGPYNPNDDYKKWYAEGKKTFTLDLLIGAKEFLGRGLAHKMIKKFIIDQFSNADYFIIDPSLSNKKAIHVYEKAGFKKVDTFFPSYDPVPHLMMRLAVK